MRFALVDITLERLTVEAAQNPRGLVVVRDELAGWFQSFARYKGSAGGSDVPNWLSMFDGGAIRYHRRTGEPKEVEADRAFVAVFGGIQPDVLKATLSDPGFIASGLAARVGFAMPPKACPKWSDHELSGEAEGAFARVLDFLRGLPFDPRSGPARVRLEYEALARFKRLNDEFAEAAEDLDGGPMAAVLPKAVRLALRLALVWQCVADAAAGRDPGRGSVTAEAMTAGEVLARWLVAEAERVYAVLAERPEDRELRTLAEWVDRKGGRVRPRDLQRSNRKYKTAAAAEEALGRLASAGYGHWEADGPAGPGRPAGRWFALHRRGGADGRHQPTGPGFDGPPATPGTADTPPEPDPNIRDFSGLFDDPSACVGRRPGGANAAGDVPPVGPPTPGVSAEPGPVSAKCRYRSRPNRGVSGLDPDGGGLVTAADLLAALTRAGRRPAVDGADLTFDRPPPPDLVPFVEVLHTGLRAVLSGRRWHGCDRATGGAGGPFPGRAFGPLAYGALDPAALLPRNVELLCVAGDAVWDRVPPSAWGRAPGVLAPAPAGPAGAAPTDAKTFKNASGFHSDSPRHSEQPCG